MKIPLQSLPGLGFRVQGVGLGLEAEQFTSMEGIGWVAAEELRL